MSCDVRLDAKGGIGGAQAHTRGKRESDIPTMHAYVHAYTYKFTVEFCARAFFMKTLHANNCRHSFCLRKNEPGVGIPNIEIPIPRRSR